MLPRAAGEPGFQRTLPALGGCRGAEAAVLPARPQPANLTGRAAATSLRGTKRSAERPERRARRGAGREDRICFTLVARALGDCHGLGPFVPPRSTARGGWEQTRALAGPCAGTPPRRELLLAAPNGEPHSRWESFGAGKRHPGSGKLTASLRSILLESFLHLLLSPRVISGSAGADPIPDAQDGAIPPRHPRTRRGGGPWLRSCRPRWAPRVGNEHQQCPCKHGVLASAGATASLPCSFISAYVSHSDITAPDLDGECARLYRSGQQPAASPQALKLGAEGKRGSIRVLLHE
ncbi:unnamed protein product [Coccothraustes coccothraustes]